VTLIILALAISLLQLLKDTLLPPCVVWHRNVGLQL
jgi:hypothetical protein